jgi:hypothetical protein
MDHTISIFAERRKLVAGGLSADGELSHRCSDLREHARSPRSGHQVRLWRHHCRSSPHTAASRRARSAERPPVFNGAAPSPPAPLGLPGAPRAEA